MVREPNINYTNVCVLSCAFCAFSKGKQNDAAGDALRGAPYLLDLEEVRRRVAEAWARGATEVCMQGGIHPEFTGETYLSLLRAAKRGAPEMHVHAFSPLEVRHGAETFAGGALRGDVSAFLGLLKSEGLGSLPGTAAEILSDEVRAHAVPGQAGRARVAGDGGGGARRGRAYDGDDDVRARRRGHDRGARRAHGGDTRRALAVRVEQARMESTERVVTEGTDEASRRNHEEIDRAVERTARSPTAAGSPSSCRFLRALRGAGVPPSETRRGPTLRECVLAHAAARLVLGSAGLVNVQASWVKMGPAMAGALLRAGCNDSAGR